MSLLYLDDITVAYDDGPQQSVPALDGVRLSLEPGESIGILGESGSGKSSLALAIPQLLPKRAFRAGRVIFRGRQLSGMRDRELAAIRGREIATVFQLPAAALNPFLTIESQVAEIVRAHGASRREARDLARAALALAFDEDDVERIAASYRHELSGGQQQRACIAQAVVARPSLIIADEPTASLDGIAQRGILDLFGRLRRELGTSLILITHNPAILPGLVDRIAVLDRGRIVEDGPMAEVYRNPRHPQTARLLRASVAKPRSDRQSAALGDMSPVLHARGVGKTYTRDSGFLFRERRVTAVEDVDFELRKGQSVAIVGASGSGKSTLARCLAGLERPTRGSVSKPGGAAVQLVAQDAAGSLNARFTAAEAIAEPLAIARRGNIKTRTSEAARLMRATGLPEESAAKRTAQFSGGQRQRLAVARAMAADADVVIWDESFSALDPPLQSEILDLLESTRRDMSTSFVFIAHDLTLAARACDEIAVMSHGRIVERKPTAALLAAPEHSYSRALVDAIPRIPPDLEATA